MRLVGPTRQLARAQTEANYKFPSIAKGVRESFRLYLFPFPFVAIFIFGLSELGGGGVTCSEEEMVTYPEYTLGSRMGF